MLDDDPFMRNLWLWMAAGAGAVSALSMQRWKNMSATDICMSLFVGATFSIFIAPYVAHDLLGVPPENRRTTACIIYVFAMSSNVLLPVVVRGLKRLAIKYFGLQSDEGEDA